MSSKRHGTAELRAQLRPVSNIPKVTRPLSDFGIEERTQVDVNVSTRAQKNEGLIPSITGKNARIAAGTTPPPNVIPFTKPRAIAAVVAANPKALVIEASAEHALKNFDNTVLPPTPKPAPLDEPTAPFAPPPVTSAAAATKPRTPTGWTPPGAVPKVPVPVGAQTLYSTPSAPPSKVGPAPSGKTVVPVPALTAQSAGPVIALPPIDLPPGGRSQIAAFPPAAPVAAYPVAKPAALPATPAPEAPPVSWFAPAAAPVQVQPIVMPAISAPAPAPAPVHEPLVAQPANKWAVFEKLGLGAPKINTQKMIVNAYRLLGFAILTIIVVVLVGYIANTAFFYLSSSWVVPMQVSPTDEKVVALQAQLAEQQNSRDRLADELAQAERAIAAQQSFQLEFAKAIKLDLDGRKAALDRVRALANNAASTRRAIKSQNAAYAGNARRRMKEEYAAGLIDRNAMLSGGVQLAALTSSNLSLAERQAEFETRAAELEATTRSLDAILSNVDGSDSALSYEVLRIKQEYAASRLDLAKAVEARNTIKASLARQDKIVTKLKGSAYLRAVEDQAAVAFVPYGNLGNVEKGTGVYACKVGMVFCHHVGEVLEVLQGEVQFKHPQRDKMLRGQMVEMKLDEEDDDAAAGDVLYIGGKPLFI